MQQTTCTLTYDCLLGTGFNQGLIFIIQKETCDDVQLIDGTKHIQRDDRIKELVFFKSLYHTLHMHPEVCDCLRFFNLVFRHLRSSRHRGRSIHLAGHTVVNQETSVHHDRGVWTEKPVESRFHKQLLVADRTGTEMGNKGHWTVRCYANHSFQCTVGLVA